MTERELCTAALNLQGSARLAYLEQACGSDHALRERVDRMLREQDRPDGVSDATASMTAEAPAGQPTADDPDATGGHYEEDDATVIVGRYRLLEPIGEGGMGSVWRAQQSEPVKRFVAVKLIKTGMDSRAVLARFEAERQALAVMDHPNIARILDGGMTGTGSPFFVMELVRGVPITEFCDARKLTPNQRLELFVPVCQAIQHAHQKGIIHRDIKPSNVLITLYDDRAVPKVIDFGIAKATGGALTDSSYHTAFGGIVGTPEYMSPEQANLYNLDIDTRSDVYSLGVLLYELLAGSPPFRSVELRKAGVLEILRFVREEEPPKPSTKLSTADKLASISANRGMEPKKLTGLLRNELDWIIMKALEKDRARRYETAAGFAADVQRFLAGEAVQAHPPSAGYRLRKFVRRNKGRVVAASLLIAALVAGLAGTSWQAIRATRAETQRSQERDRAIKSEGEARQLQAKAQQEEQKAVKAAAEANAMNRFFKELTLESRRSVKEGGQWRAKTVDEAVAIIDTEPIRALFADHPLAEAEIREWLGSSASSIGGFATILTFPGRPQKKRPVTHHYAEGNVTLLLDPEAVRRHLERAVELRRVHLGPDDPKTLATMHKLGDTYLSQGHTAEALVVLSELVARSNATLGPGHDSTLGYKASLAMAYEAAQKTDDSLRTWNDCYGSAKDKCGRDSEQALNFLDSLAGACERAGRLEEALRHSEESLRGRRTLATAPMDVGLRMCLERVARLHHALHDYHRAEPLWREALLLVSQDEYVKSEILGPLGGCLLHNAKPAEAETVLRECLAIQEKTAPNVWSTFHTKSLLGASLLGQKRFAEAETLLLAGYTGMKRRENQITMKDKVCLTEGLARLVLLYDVWGKKGKADEWRTRMEAERPRSPAKP
jgi:serine/threonine protein kinase/tetratricopeptide (TPR) repeat protein/type II secretory pathway pseudopilin PulG